MVKQKVVMKVSMNGPKSRTKALQAVVAAPGVISAALEGDDRSKVVVIGEGIDCVALAKLLRKKLDYVEIVTVSAEDEKDKEKDSKIEYSTWPYQMRGMAFIFEVNQKSVDQYIANISKSEVVKKPKLEISSKMLLCSSKM
ncbi:hypothetical protein QJS04_geneDACA007828 [Acorus gramineus]|uniref:Uncharacterized protein n=1 Tax=Acorus gramineus TaxID=55184 RepID=A0AAV9BB95_ACOGR|nr:hypothetical protein QJS04_geneDACA007828 [Acorus gramineus]